MLMKLNQLMYELIQRYMTRWVLDDSLRFSHTFAVARAKPRPTDSKSERHGGRCECAIDECSTKVIFHGARKAHLSPGAGQFGISTLHWSTAFRTEHARNFRMSSGGLTYSR